MNRKIEKRANKLNKTKEEVEKYESYTIKIQRHLPISFVYYIKYANGEIRQNLFEYFGLDAPKKLYEKLREDALHIAQEYLDKKIKMKDLSETQKMEYKNAKKCNICIRYLKDTPPAIEKDLRILNKKIDIASKILLWIKEQEDEFKEIVDKAKNKYEKEGGDMNTFYENYAFKLKNIKLKDEEELLILYFLI